MKGPEKETIEKLMREAAEALPVSGETELQVVVRFLFVCFLMCLFECLFLCLFFCLFAFCFLFVCLFAVETLPVRQSCRS